MPSESKTVGSLQPHRSPDWHHLLQPSVTVLVRNPLRPEAFGYPCLSERKDVRRPSLGDAQSSYQISRDISVSQRLSNMIVIVALDQIAIRGMCTNAAFIGSLSSSTYVAFAFPVYASGTAEPPQHEC